MNFKSTLLAFSLVVGTMATSQAAIMVQTLSCTAPAKAGHILMGAPSSKLRVVTRSAISGTGTNYFLITTPMIANPTSQEVPLVISTSQNKEGWVELESENTAVLIKEDNSRALIKYESGATAKCKADEII